jgi:quinol monooxygenase YgiN
VLSIIAKWSIKPGCDQETVVALGELAESVKREQPLRTMYVIHTPVAEGSRPTPVPNEVVFISGWPDRAAFEQHLKGPVFQHYARLQQVKQAVDPDGIFGFQQGIGSPFRPDTAEPLNLSPLNRTQLPGKDGPR